MLNIEYLIANAKNIDQQAITWAINSLKKTLEFQNICPKA
jgi:hypothetical protein